MSMEKKKKESTTRVHRLPGWKEGEKKKKRSVQERGECIINTNLRVAAEFRKRRDVCNSGGRKKKERGEGGKAFRRQRGLVSMIPWGLPICWKKDKKGRETCLLQGEKKKGGRRWAINRNFFFSPHERQGGGGGKKGKPLLITLHLLRGGGGRKKRNAHT